MEPPNHPGGRSRLARRHVAALCAWALLTVMAAAGCSGAGDGDSDLVVLRGEAMAHAEFDGLRLVQETERSAVEEGATGKPTYARITRIFEPTGAVTAEQGALDIADTAKAGGFTLVSQTSQGFTLTKTVDRDASSQRIDLKAVAAPREGTQSVFLYLTLY